MTDMSNTTYDSIIIGGGHNGLVCAAYLAKAGKRVLVLEARGEIGGAANTMTLCDGWKVSPCAHYLNQLNSTVRRDLNLTSHGLKMAGSDISTIALDPEGDHLFLNDQGASGAGISANDAANYGRFMKLMQQYSTTLGFLVDLPPIDIFNPDWDDKVAALKLGWNVRFGLGAEKMSEFLRMVGMNIYDVLDDEFDNPTLKGALAFDAVLGTHTGPRSPGSVLTFLYRLVAGTDGAVELPEGGMGAVTSAMAKAATGFGATIKTGARAASVIVENCVATGVVLDNGATYSATHIISNADPKTTVMDIVGPRHFEADFVKRVDNIRMRGNAAKLHIALKSLPRFTNLSAEQLRSRLLIAPTHDDVERAFNHAKYGEASANPMMEISIPSIDDETLCDEGHVLSAIVQYAPYTLKGGWTEAAKDNFRDACIDRIARYAPDIRDHIEAAELVTPADLEQRYGMRGGNWHHGELTLDQMLMLRPAPEASRYALPLDGLYLCGAGAHPGGGVMGAAGKNAAKTILSEGRS